MSWLYEPWIFVCMEIIESELSDSFAAQSPPFVFAPSSGENTKNSLSQSSLGVIDTRGQVVF